MSYLIITNKYTICPIDVKQNLPKKMGTASSSIFAYNGEAVPKS